MKVIISNNSIVPYRTSFLNIFFSKYSHSLNGSIVLYLTDNESIRNWGGNNEGQFDFHILPRFLQLRNKKTTTSDYIFNYSFLKYLNNTNIFYSMGYSYPTYLTMALFSKIKGIKTACFCETNITDKKRSLIKSRLKFFLLNCLYDRFFVPGINAEKYLLDLGISRSKIRMVGNSAPFINNKKILNISNDDNVFNIIYVGRLSDEKNILETLRYLEYVNYTINITIVGSGPLDNDVKFIASQSKHHYILLSNLEREELPDIYIKNDLLLLPSLSETWGLVANEAVSYGLALLLSENVGCSPELIKNNGFTYKLDSKADFLEKLRLIKENKKKYKESSFLLAEKISAERNSKLLYEALEELYESD